LWCFRLDGEEFEYEMREFDEKLEDESSGEVEKCLKFEKK
jgi:hypothetical protein